MDQTIDIRETGIPDGVMDLVQRLPDPETLQGPAVTITLRFHNIFVYTTGLVLLATWRKALPDGVKVVIDDSACQETTRRLLTNTGFRDIIETGAEGPSTIYRFSGRVPIQPIVRGYSTERVISDISQSLDAFAGQVEDSSPFRVMLSELCENTFVHSEFETTGYICARFDSVNNKCEIAIADSGIGILNSYLEGTNEEANQRIGHGASSIELAVDALSSSKRTPGPGTVTSHFGYGLFIVRRLVEENGGRLTIVSGDECVNIERYQQKRVPLTHGWRGTFVGLLIDIANPLPLAEVYEEGIAKHVSDVPDGSPSVAPKPPPVEIREVALSRYGNQLLTRELGIAIRADIATALAGGDRVKVVLEDIEDITPSVADECFGRLAESLGKEAFDRRVILAGGSQLIQRLIQFVIQNRLDKAE